MPATIGRTKRSEKGLLTPDNCVVALIDHQPQMMFGVAGVDRQSIINSTVAIAKAARVFDVPVVLSTVETKSFSGNLWPQIRAVFPEQPAIERSSMNAWDDKNFVAAIKATGRKKIVLAGLWTEVCVTFPTVQAIHDGYDVYVVEDCCGDVSQLAHDNAMKRVIQAGAKPVTSLQVMLEFQRDWAEKDTYDAVMERLHGRKGDTRFRPESREHELLPTGRLDRRHEVLVVPGVHGGPLDRRLLRKHRADLWPLIPTEALRFDRCEDDRHIEHPGGLCEGDGVVDDRLAIEIRDTEDHLGLVIDECDDAIVRSQ